MSNYWFLRTTDTYNTWSPRFSVEADYVARYDISISGDWATLEINGTINLVAERQFAYQYDVLTSVERDFEAIYLVDGEPPAPPIPVSRDFTFVYAIDSTVATSAVYRDFSYIWQADGVVIVDFSPVYSVLADTAFPGWQEETLVDDDWTPAVLGSNLWTPVTQPTTTWN